MHDFEGKVAVITGGASGIGLAMAQRFARAGMKLVLADIEETALGNATQALTESGTEAIGVVTDVSEYESVERLLAAATERFDRVHVLCNNAGVQIAGNTWEYSLGQWKWILGVNLWGVIHGVHAFVPHMIAHGDPGHIVNTSSMAGLLSIPYMSAYQVTKHSVVTLTESLSLELALVAPQLKASVLCPAFVQTNLHKSDRNRPEALRDKSRMDEATEQFLADSVKGLVEGGKPPEAIAEAVFDTLKSPRVHIFTHPKVLPAIQKRIESVLGDAPNGDGG